MQKSKFDWIIDLKVSDKRILNAIQQKIQFRQAHLAHANQDKKTRDDLSTIQGDMVVSLIEVKGVQLTCNGKAVFASDRVANTTKAKGGKSSAAYDFELPQYDPNGKYVLRAEITNIGKRGGWDMELCIRKNSSPKKDN